MKNFTYKSLLKYIFCAFLFYLANGISEGVPFSVCLLPVFMGIGLNPVLVSLIFCSVNFFAFSIPLSLALIPTAGFFTLVYLIYSIKKATVKGELFIYVCISLVPYFLAPFNGSIYSKLVYSAIIYAFAIIFNLAMQALYLNRFKRKNTPNQQIAFYLFIIIFSVAFIKLTGVRFYTFIALTAMLFLCKFFKGTTAFIPAFILPLAISLYMQSFYPLAIFEIYCAIIIIFSKKSILLSALALILAQVAVNYFSGDILSFSPVDYFYTFAPSLIYLFIPQKLVDKLKNFTLRFEEPEITREIINVERGALSLKLNDLSSLFYDMVDALNGFDDLFLTKEKLLQKISDELIVNVCSACPYFTDCSRKKHPKKSDITKLVSVGISKGKVSLIDLSRDFSSYCYSVNNMIYEINRLIFLYNEQMQACEQTKKYTSLISMQAGGLAEVLKNLAFELSEQIDFKLAKEHKIFEKLTEYGVAPKQIVCVGSDYHLFFGKEKINFINLSKILSEILNKPMSLYTKTEVGAGVLAIFKKSPLMDASFGVAQIAKENCSICGDTHSLKQIDEGRFIISLCDGMGSGGKAHKNSQTAINLFETLYKAGLNKNATLEFSNKILSVCSEDSFSTLDCAVFDLFEGKCDIIKIGASCGFLVKEEVVKVIENTSLPLGILEEVTPNLCTLNLEQGDMLVILSDGITDAFFSNTDTVDFLLTQKSNNPQVLADNLLHYALTQNGGTAKDDMTAIVVKVYSK